MMEQTHLRLFWRKLQLNIWDILEENGQSGKWWSQWPSMTIQAALFSKNHAHTGRSGAFRLYLRGGWCLWHSRCLDNRLCKRICSRLWCRAPRRWRAAYCTSCRWSSWGETLCYGPSGPGRWERCPANNHHTWCRTAWGKDNKQGWLILLWILILF